MLEIRIGWWNTGLNPPRSRKMHAKSPSSVYAGLGRLLDKVDLLFLGETIVSKDIVDVINNYNLSHMPPFSKRLFQIDARRTTDENNKFRTMCLYDMSRISLNNDCKVEDWLSLSEDENAKYYRVGQRYDFVLPSPLGKTSFYVAHWSQYSEEDGEAMKLLAAHNLRSKMVGYADDPIVCLGDFNCEPYSKPIAALGATRSVDYLMRRGGFFNGFWDFHGYGSIASENTRFMKTAYPLFDQMLINKIIFQRLNGRFVCEVLDESIYSPLDGEHRPIVVAFSF